MLRGEVARTAGNEQELLDMEGEVLVDYFKSDRGCSGLINLISSLSSRNMATFCCAFLIDLTQPLFQKLLEIAFRDRRPFRMRLPAEIVKKEKNLLDALVRGSGAILPLTWVALRAASERVAQSAKAE